MTTRSFTVNTLHASAGVIVWALHFLAIYGFTALACERGFDRLQWMGAGVITWWVLGATAVAALTMLGLIARVMRRPVREFADWLGIGLTGLALVGVLYEGIPVLMVSPCV